MARRQAHLKSAQARSKPPRRRNRPTWLRSQEEKEPMSDFQVALTNTAGISSVASFWVFVASNGVRRWKDVLLKSASLVMALGFVSLTAAIVMRGFEAGRFP